VLKNLAQHHRGIGRPVLDALLDFRGISGDLRNKLAGLDHHLRHDAAEQSQNDQQRHTEDEDNGPRAGNPPSLQKINHGSSR